MFDSDNDEDKSELFIAKDERENGGVEDNLRNVDSDVESADCGGEEDEVNEVEDTQEEEGGLDQLVHLTIVNEGYADYCEFLRGKKTSLDKDLEKLNVQLDEAIEANEADIVDLLTFTTKVVKDFGFPSTKWRADHAAFVESYEATQARDLKLRKGVPVDLEGRRGVIKELHEQEAASLAEKDQLAKELREVGLLEGRVKSLSTQLEREKRDGEASVLRLEGDVEQLERAVKLKSTTRAFPSCNFGTAVVSRPSAQVNPQKSLTYHHPAVATSSSRAVEQFRWQRPVPATSASSLSLVVPKPVAISQNPTRPSNFVGQNNFGCQPSRGLSQPGVGWPSVVAVAPQPPACVSHASRSVVQVTRSSATSGHQQLQKQYREGVKPKDHRQTGVVPKQSILQQKALEDEMLLRTITEEQERIRRNQQMPLNTKAAKMPPSASLGAQNRAYFPPSFSSSSSSSSSSLNSPLMSRELVPLASKRIKLEHDVSGVQVEEIHDDETEAPPFRNAFASNRSSSSAQHLLLRDSGRVDGRDQSLAGQRGQTNSARGGKSAATVAPTSWSLPRRY